MHLQSSTFVSLLGLLSIQPVKSAPSPQGESTATLATLASVPQETPVIETDVEGAIADSTIGIDSSGPPIRGRYVFGCVLGVSATDCKSWNSNGPGGYWIQKYELDEISSEARGLVFSANGLLLAVALESGIILWDTITGTVQQTIKGHLEWGRVESVAFSSDSQLLAFIHQHSAVKLWDAITGTQKYKFEVYNFGYQVAFSPDNQFLAFGHPKGTILWDLATYRVYKENSNPASIIAYSPDGMRTNKIWWHSL
ncbi:WD40-repeat-containing domain protein [Trichoderma evansii]